MPDRRPRTHTALRTLLTTAPPAAVWMLAMFGTLHPGAAQVGFVVLAVAWFVVLVATLPHDRPRPPAPQAATDAGHGDATVERDSAAA